MILSENRSHPTSHSVLRRTARSTRRSLGEGGLFGIMRSPDPEACERLSDARKVENPEHGPISMKSDHILKRKQGADIADDAAPAAGLAERRQEALRPAVDIVLLDNRDHPLVAHPALRLRHFERPPNGGR